VVSYGDVERLNAAFNQGAIDLRLCPYPGKVVTGRVKGKGLKSRAKPGKVQNAKWGKTATTISRVKEGLLRNLALPVQRHRLE
jgi:hypothetical protein